MSVSSNPPILASPVRELYELINSMEDFRDANIRQRVSQLLKTCLDNNLSAETPIGKLQLPMLPIAVLAGDEAIVDRLIDKEGVDVNKKFENQRDHRDVVSCAIYSRNPSMITQLLQNRARVNQHHFNLALDECISVAREDKIVARAHARAIQDRSQRKIAMHDKIQELVVDKIALLWEALLEKDGQVVSRRSFLYALEQPRLLELLLDNRARGMQDLLHSAITSLTRQENTIDRERGFSLNTPRSIELLVRSGERVNEKNCHGNTALHLECRMFNDVGVVGALLANGADKALVNEAGDTPLHESAQGSSRNLASHLRVIEILSDNLEAVNAKNREGESPLHLACETHKPAEVVGALLARGAKANARDNKGNTPLHLLAAKESSKENTDNIARVVASLLRAARPHPSKR